MFSISNMMSIKFTNFVEQFLHAMFKMWWENIRVGLPTINLFQKVDFYLEVWICNATMSSAFKVVTKKGLCESREVSAAIMGSLEKSFSTSKLTRMSTWSMDFSSKNLEIFWEFLPDRENFTTNSSCITKGWWHSPL